MKLITTIMLALALVAAGCGNSETKRAERGNQIQSQFNACVSQLTADDIAEYNACVRQSNRAYDRAGIQ